MFLKELRKAGLWGLGALLLSTGLVFAADTVLTGAKIYTAPNANPIDYGVVVISKDRIDAIGAASDISIPVNVEAVDVSGKTITAGLWNTHVHFNWRPPVDLAQAESMMRDMLLQYGFVHVLDTGSILEISVGLRDAVESGLLPGPNIILANGSLVPPGSSPFYVRPAVLPDAAPLEEAQAQVDGLLNSGADGIKIFTGAIVSLGNIVPMNESQVRAITAATHKRDSFVVAHPSNNEGAWAAINGDVDIFAHTFPQENWDRSIPQVMVDKGIAMIPTLMLWRFDLARFGVPEAGILRSIKAAQEQLKMFSELGGEVMFGTDVGYVTNFDPTDEYVYMLDAGLTFEQILTSLTTAPSRRFGMQDRTGRLETGMDADLVVLNEDPAQDITAFARPELVMRRGKIVYRRDE